MNLFVHKNRNLVVAADEQDDSSDSLSVLWVGVSPTVQGTARRGRPPANKDQYKMIPKSELVALDPTLVTDELRSQVERRLAKWKADYATTDSTESSVDA